MATKYRVTVGNMSEEFLTEEEALIAYPTETPDPITYNISDGIPLPTWADVDNLQNQLLSVNSSVMKRVVRYDTQDKLTGKTPKENSTKFQELLQYCQDIRDADETNHATPQLALDALNALSEPA